MKIAKAFEIQRQYQKHRERLCSIRSLNARKSVTMSTHKTIDRINNYKKVKSNSYILKDYHQQQEIKYQNELLHKNLTKVYARDRTNCILKEFNEQEVRVLYRTSSQNTVRSVESSRIKEENTKLNKKLTLARSVYRKFREKEGRKKEVHGRSDSSHRQEIIKILESQLGFKPRVLFPAVRVKQEKKEKKEKRKRFNLSCGK